MSIEAIPSLVAAAAASPASSAATTSTLAAKQLESDQQQPADSQAYTVQLTEAQRVYQLYDQGQQVPQIASTLSLSVTAVNSYLNLSSSGS
jgi:DNA-binding NarL/FixJ family response regulator